MPAHRTLRLSSTEPRSIITTSRPLPRTQYEASVRGTAACVITERRHLGLGLGSGSRCVSVRPSSLTRASISTRATRSPRGPECCRAERQRATQRRTVPGLRCSLNSSTRTAAMSPSCRWVATGPGRVGVRVIRQLCPARKPAKRVDGPLCPWTKRPPRQTEEPVSPEMDPDVVARRFVQSTRSRRVEHALGGSRQTLPAALESLLS